MPLAAAVEVASIIGGIDTEPVRGAMPEPALVFLAYAEICRLRRPGRWRRRDRYSIWSDVPMAAAVAVSSIIGGIDVELV